MNEDLKKLKGQIGVALLAAGTLISHAVAQETPTPTCTQAPTPPTGECDLTAEIAKLWPPNHRYKAIVFKNSSGAIVEPSVTAIYQDEPTRVIGSGSFCPDAKVTDNGAVQIRAERTGTRRIPGDGRVYHIDYSLRTDSDICTGTTTVCMPHDHGWRGACIDGGPLYDSMSCSLRKMSDLKISKNTGEKRGS